MDISLEPTIDTAYGTRGTLGTFALSGGQFELCEFDTGTKGSSIADHVSKSGVGHNYVAFANTGDGNGLTLTLPVVVSTLLVVPFLAHQLPMLQISTICKH